LSPPGRTAAATTIVGMAPLLLDVFFASMAVTIMAVTITAGLGFATLLTLIGVPVFYHTYLRMKRRAQDMIAGSTLMAAKPFLGKPKLAAERRQNRGTGGA
jgi:hypothetical protein